MAHSYYGIVLLALALFLATGKFFFHARMLLQIHVPHPLACGAPRGQQ